MRQLLCLALLLFVSRSARAEPTGGVELLQQVAGNWLQERDRWAFTQRVREYDGRELKQERVEHYDPSRGHAGRWRLVSIDGHPPTPKQWQDWYRRKNRHQQRKRPTVADNLDFARASIIEETTEIVRYELPLRSNVEWFFPINKVELIVTINKRGPALEQVQARINEPFKVALGLARVLDVDLDLQMEPPPPEDPADARPSGTAQAVVTKFGDRVEYFWSNFHRVPPQSNGASTAVESAGHSLPVRRTPGDKGAR